MTTDEGLLEATRRVSRTAPADVRAGGRGVDDVITQVIDETDIATEIIQIDRSAAGPSRSMSGQLRSAAVWSGLNSFVLRFAQFFVGVVTARIIAPHQFGVFAVALTVYTVVINVSELGVSAALVRARGDIKRIAPTVATLAVASATVLASAMFLAAGPFASALGAPAAATAIRILSTTVLLAGITAVPYAMLVREFRQDKRFLADGANFAISTTVIIALGLAGFGATALAMANVCGQLASLVLLMIMIRPRFWPGWNRAEAGQILSYSLPLAGASLVTFSINNVDYIVVGHLLGALPLGLYTLAYNISGWPVSVFSLMINEVALPAFAHARDDLKGLPRRARGALSITAAVALPVSAICLALAHPLVTSVYGHRWGDAAPVLALLGVFGSMRIILTLFTNILVALGRSRVVLALQLVWMASLLPGLIVGVSHRGIVGAAIAQEVVALGIVLPLSLVAVSRAGAGSVWRLLASCTRPLLAAAVAGGAAFAGTQLFASGWLQLVVGAILGVAGYLAVAGTWTRRLLQDAASHWNSQDDARPEPTGRYVARHRQVRA